MNVKEKVQRFVFLDYVEQSVKQGDHRAKITDLFKAIIDAAREEFTEDNKPTLDGFLEDCFKASMKGL